MMIFFHGFLLLLYDKFIGFCKNITIYETAGSFSFLEDALEYFNPESGELMLGDIVISKEKVVSQAEEYGHSLLREYAFLIAHSMLHLFGYDHMEEVERKEMEMHQKKIMELVNITR